MVKKATLGVLMLLLFGLVMNYGPVAKAQTASPSQAIITVSGVPTGTKGLAVEVTVDTAVVTLDSGATSSVSGALAVVGSMSEGVGIIGTSGDLPDTFTITVPLMGVAAGTSMLSVGAVLDMLGGTAITGASATVDASSITVSAAGTTTTGGGAGGQLSSDTITVSVEGTAVGETNALNVTLSFSDSTVASLDTGVTFMGTGATQLLTDVNTTNNVLTAVWDGSITDQKAVITAMLKAGTMAGTTTISVTKVEAAGGTDITASVAATVDPASVTNSAKTATSDCGTFELVDAGTLTGPGKAAVAFEVTGGASDLSATLNGAKVELVGGKSAGIAIVTVPASGTLSLSLSAMCGGMTQSVDLGTIDVDAGEGKAPKVNSAQAQNKKSGTKLTVTGKKFSKTDTTVQIVPTDRDATSTKVKGAAIKASYSASECIPKGSYVNVSTPGGTAAKKIKVRGNCTNSLVE